MKGAQASKQGFPHTSSLAPSVQAPNWPSVGTGVSPGPEGNRGGNLVRGKSRIERKEKKLGSRESRKKANLIPEMVDFKPERTDLRPEKADSSLRAKLMSEKPNIKSE